VLAIQVVLLMWKERESGEVSQSRGNINEENGTSNTEETQK